MVDKIIIANSTIKTIVDTVNDTIDELATKPSIINPEFSGVMTAEGSVISSNTPYIQLNEANNASSVQHRISIVDGDLRQDSYSKANNFISNDYIIEKNLSGASAHRFKIADVEKGSITSNGIHTSFEVRANTIVSETTVQGGSSLASQPSIIPGDDVYSGFFSPSTNVVGTAINGTEVSRATSTRFAFGVSSPSRYVHFKSPFEDTFIRLESANTSQSAIEFYTTGKATNYWIGKRNETGTHLSIVNANGPSSDNGILVAEDGKIGIGKTPSSVSQLDSVGDIVSNKSNRGQFVARNTNYSAIIDNDDSTTSIRLTSSGVTDGSPISFNPFSITNSTGSLSLANGNVIIDTSGNINGDGSITADNGFFTNYVFHRTATTGDGFGEINGYTDGGMKLRAYNGENRDAYLDINPLPDGTNSKSGYVRFFRETNSANSHLIQIFKGDGTSTATSTITSDGNASFNGVISSGIGSQSSPAFRSSTYYNTGMFFPSSGRISFSFVGVSNIEMNSTGIGIGGITPTSSIDIANGTSSTIRLREPTSTYGYQIRSNVSDVNNYGLVIEDLSGTDLYTITSGPSGSHIWTINGSEKMKMISSGYVSIGGATPGYQLDVVGDIRARDRILVGTSTGTAFGNDNLIKPALSSAFLNIKGGAGQSKITLGNDAITIVGGTSGGTISFNTGAGENDGGTEISRFDAAGNLLINRTTVSGSYKLDVNGQINATGINVNGSSIIGPTGNLTFERTASGSDVAAVVRNLSGTNGSQARVDLSVNKPNCYGISYVQADTNPVMRVSTGTGITGGYEIDNGSATAPIRFMQAGNSKLEVGSDGNVSATGTIDAAGFTIGGSPLNTGPLSAEYTSSEQSIISSGALTLTHGLGVVPKIVTVELVCKEAEAVYSIGDVVVYGFAADESINSGITITKDATNLKCIYGNHVNVFSIGIKSVGQTVQLTNTKWRVVIRAFA